jgi:hypothetical protein
MRGGLASYSKVHTGCTFRYRRNFFDGSWLIVVSTSEPLVACGHSAALFIAGFCRRKAHRPLLSRALLIGRESPWVSRQDSRFLGFGFR